MDNVASKHEFQLLSLAEASSEGDDLHKNMERLGEVAQRLDRIHEFRKGQLVKWKPGLQNRRLPGYNEPAIVRSVLNEPLQDPNENSAASPYFREPLTLVIGHFIDGDFVEFRVDGRRFEPF